MTQDETIVQIDQMGDKLQAEIADLTAQALTLDEAKARLIAADQPAPSTVKSAA